MKFELVWLLIIIGVCSGITQVHIAGRDQTAWMNFYEVWPKPGFGFSSGVPASSLIVSPSSQTHGFFSNVASSRTALQMQGFTRIDQTVEDFLLSRQNVQVNNKRQLRHQTQSVLQFLPENNGIQQEVHVPMTQLQRHVGRETELSKTKMQIEDPANEQHLEPFSLQKARKFKTLLQIPHAEELLLTPGSRETELNKTKMQIEDPANKQHLEPFSLQKARKFKTLLQIPNAKELLLTPGSRETDLSKTKMQIKDRANKQHLEPFSLQKARKFKTLLQIPHAKELLLTPGKNLQDNVKYSKSKGIQLPLLIDEEILRGLQGRQNNEKRIHMDRVIEHISIPNIKRIHSTIYELKNSDIFSQKGMLGQEFLRKNLNNIENEAKQYFKFLRPITDSRIQTTENQPVKEMFDKQENKITKKAFDIIRNFDKHIEALQLKKASTKKFRQNKSNQSKSHVNIDMNIRKIDSRQSKETPNNTYHEHINNTVDKPSLINESKNRVTYKASVTRQGHIEDVETHQNDENIQTKPRDFIETSQPDKSGAFVIKILRASNNVPNMLRSFVESVDQEKIKDNTADGLIKPDIIWIGKPKFNAKRTFRISNNSDKTHPQRNVVVPITDTSLQNTTSDPKPTLLENLRNVNRVDTAKIKAVNFLLNGKQSKENRNNGVKLFEKPKQPSFNGISYRSDALETPAQTSRRYAKKDSSHLLVNTKKTTAYISPNSATYRRDSLGHTTNYVPHDKGRQVPIDLYENFQTSSVVLRRKPENKRTENFPSSTWANNGNKKNAKIAIIDLLKNVDQIRNNKSKIIYQKAKDRQTLTRNDYSGGTSMNFSHAKDTNNVKNTNSNHVLPSANLSTANFPTIPTGSSKPDKSGIKGTKHVQENPKTSQGLTPKSKANEFTFITVNPTLNNLPNNETILSKGNGIISGESKLSSAYVTTLSDEMKRSKKTTKIKSDKLNGKEIPRIKLNEKESPRIKLNEKESYLSKVQNEILNTSGMHNGEESVLVLEEKSNIVNNVKTQYATNKMQKAMAKSNYSGYGPPPHHHVEIEKRIPENVEITQTANNGIRSYVNKDLKSDGSPTSQKTFRDLNTNQASRRQDTEFSGNNPLTKLLKRDFSSTAILPTPSYPHKSKHLSYDSSSQSPKIINVSMQKWINLNSKTKSRSEIALPDKMPFNRLLASFQNPVDTDTTTGLKSFSESNFDSNKKEIILPDKPSDLLLNHNKTENNITSFQNPFSPSLATTDYKGMERITTPMPLEIEPPNKTFNKHQQSGLVRSNYENSNLHSYIKISNADQQQINTGHILYTGKPHFSNLKTKGILHIVGTKENNNVPSKPLDFIIPHHVPELQTNTQENVYPFKFQNKYSNTSGMHNEGKYVLSIKEKSNMDKNVKTKYTANKTQTTMANYSGYTSSHYHIEAEKRIPEKIVNTQTADNGIRSYIRMNLKSKGSPTGQKDLRGLNTNDPLQRQATGFSGSSPFTKLLNKKFSSTKILSTPSYHEKSKNLPYDSSTQTPNINNATTNTLVNLNSKTQSQSEIVLRDLLLFNKPFASFLNPANSKIDIKHTNARNASTEHSYQHSGPPSNGSDTHLSAVIQNEILTTSVTLPTPVIKHKNKTDFYLVPVKHLERQNSKRIFGSNEGRKVSDTHSLRLESYKQQHPVVRVDSTYSGNAEKLALPKESLDLFENSFKPDKELFDTKRLDLFNDGSRDQRENKHSNDALTISAIKPVNFLFSNETFLPDKNINHHQTTNKGVDHEYNFRINGNSFNRKKIKDIHIGAKTSKSAEHKISDIRNYKHEMSKPKQTNDSIQLKHSVTHTNSRNRKRYILDKLHHNGIQQKYNNENGYPRNRNQRLSSEIPQRKKIGEPRKFSGGQSLNVQRPTHHKRSHHKAEKENPFYKASKTLRRYPTRRINGFFRWNRKLTQLLIEIRRHQGRKFDDRRGRGNLWKAVVKKFNKYSKRKATLSQLQSKWREIQNRDRYNRFYNFWKSKKSKNRRRKGKYETSTIKPKCAMSNRSSENSRQVTC